MRADLEATGRSAGSRARVGQDELFAFRRSLPGDRRLFRHHILASMAYTRMLGKQDILSSEHSATLLSGLAELLAQPPDLSGESSGDLFSAVDAALRGRLGSAGAQLAAMRARHDQAATDLRLWTREEILAECELIAALQRVLLRLAETHGQVLMPGYAHLQRTQPVLLGHHLLAYHEMVYRDSFRLRETYVRSDILPLGAGALAGSEYPLDRAYVAQLLGMHAMTRNSLDAVGDRDFLVEHLAELAILAMHLSRLAEDLVLWSTTEFGFVTLDANSSGDEPDDPTAAQCSPLAEIVRGRTGRVYGALSNVLTVMKGLPLSYHRDLQEQNEPYFDAADTVRASLAIAAHALNTAHWRVESMQAAAHASVRETARRTAADAAAAQDVRGGTAPSRVVAAVADGYSKIEFLENWVAEQRTKLPTVETLLP